MTIYQMSVSYQDAFERRGTKRYELDAIDHPTAVTNALALADALAGIMLADILSYSVGLDVIYADSVVAGANKDTGVTISVDLGGGKRASLKIPTPLLTLINPDGTLDMADALITTLETLFTSGKVLISDGETALDFINGKLDK